MSAAAFFSPRIFAGLSSPHPSLASSRVVVLPVPYDSTSEYKSGAREGPRAILDASAYLELYDHELDAEIHLVGIHTLPELEPVMSGPEPTIQRVYQAAKGVLQQDKLLVMLGGEHSLTLGPVRACCEKYSDLSVLQLDAHADLRDSYQGTPFSHACVMRRVWELCPVIQVGLRSLSREERDFLQEERSKPLYTGRPLDTNNVERVVSALSPHVYVTIDLDVFDPSVMAAVGTPEPGGLGWEQVLTLLRAVARRRSIVGFDVVELCPREGPSSCAFLAAKLTYKLIGYATLPLTPGRRSGTLSPEV